MKNKIIALLFVLLLGTFAGLTADDFSKSDLFKISSFNPTLTGIFTEGMNSLHTGMVEFDGLNSSLFMDNKVKWTSGILASGLLGYMLKLSENFAIPITLTYNVMYSEDDYANPPYYRDRVGLMLGSGLIFYGRYGLLAGYAGYGLESGHEIIWFEDDIKWSENKFRWAVCPVINAEEYPLLNSFVRLIDGFFSLEQLRMDRDEFMPTYKANVLFKDITLLEKDITLFGNKFDFFKMSLGAYSMKDWYDFDAKYNLHAGKIDFKLGTNYNDSTTIIGIEAGYRDFFDIQRTTQEFENGLYAKIALTLTLDLRETQGGIILYFESGSMSFFKNGIFGFLIAIRHEMFSLSSLFRTEGWLIKMKILFDEGSANGGQW